MDKQEEKIIEQLEDMMASDGWKIFHQTACDEFDALSTDFYRARTERDLGIIQGKGVILEMIINYPKVVENMKEGKAPEDE